MDLARQFDSYCERTDLTYWSEPLNALTNLAFIIAALIMWRRSDGVAGGQLLCAILFAIGVGSFLFHTHATGWAALADVIPIALFILTYLFLVHRDFVGLSGWRPWLATLGFFPYVAVMVPVLNTLPFFRISNAYWTVPVLLFIYAWFLRKRLHQAARGMVIGGGILCLSITLRSVDEIWCDVFPIGTHIFWHILNGIMLGWMIEVYVRQRKTQTSGRGEFRT